MAKNEIYTCDGCGKQKQEVNHWWMFSTTYVSGAFIVLPWDEKTNLSGHACGQSCMSKKLSEWMQKQSAASEKGKG